MGCTLATASRVAHINENSSETHASTTGPSLSSSQGMGTPTVSPRLETLSLPSPHLDFTSHLSNDRRRLLVTCRDALTYRLSLAPSPSHEPRTPLVSPASFSYTQPQAITNASDLGLEFPIPAEGFRLPDVNPFPTQNSPYDRCEFTIPFVGSDLCAHHPRSSVARI